MPELQAGGFCTLVLYVHIGSGILRRLETACCFPAAVASGSVQWVSHVLVLEKTDRLPALSELVWFCDSPGMRAFPVVTLG